MDGTAESDVMRRMTAGLGAIAMLAALLTAPLYHIHDKDHRGESSPRAHAHLPKSESSDHPSDSVVEDRDSHHSARYVDFFIFNAPAAGADLVAELATTSFIAILAVSAGVIMDAVPRSHGPPALTLSVPRSPPTA